jgi:hypothetical protein
MEIRDLENEIISDDGDDDANLKYIIILYYI